MSNIERFDKFVGVLFGRLYSAFPVPLRIDPESFITEFLDEMDSVDSAIEFPEFFRSNIKWLERYGYIWIAVDLSSFHGHEYDVVLSERGLEALRRVPASLEGNASIGERLVAFSKSKASGAIGTLIDLVITTAAKG